MYNQRPNLILGFHGCDQSVRDELMLDPNKYKNGSSGKVGGKGIICFFC
ncbi:hypothetical protein SAMN04488023_12357, partial [Pedobacter rhizosphaerae]